MDRPYHHQKWLVEMLQQFNNPRAVEVGVASGRTSQYLLHHVPALTLWMVDHWKCPEHGTRKTQGTYDQAKKTAEMRTQFAQHRRFLMPLKSVEAASKFDNQVFDLVFIDACHFHEHVLADCAAWWPTLRAGGVFCGHDIDSRKDKEGIWGVRKAVAQFCRLMGLHFTVEQNVWLIRK